MTQLTATFTVTIKTKPDGDYYFDHDDLVRNAVPWIEGGLDDRDDIAEVTITEQPAAVSAAVAPPTGRAPYGCPDCTCVPFTRKDGTPRACGPNDTVDDISGWETGRDCPHHAPADTTHGLSVPHADALWDAVAIPGPHTPTYPEQHERVCRAVRDILDELTPARDDAAYQNYSAEGHALPASDMADAVLAVLPEPADRAAEPVCICGHPNEQHFEDVCQTCGCGDYLEPQDAAEVIARWRQAALKARADRAAVLTEPERKMLAFALEITQEEIHARSLDLADNDKAALVSLRRMADETATETPAAVDLPTLAAALDGLHTLIATSSRDWQTYRVDAWLWAVLCGWDCEQTEHDDTCVHGALEETASMHGWDEATVAKARRYRAAVRAVTETLPAAGARQDGAET